VLVSMQSMVSISMQRMLFESLQSMVPVSINRMLLESMQSKVPVSIKRMLLEFMQSMVPVSMQRMTSSNALIINYHPRKLLFLKNKYIENTCPLDGSHLTTIIFTIIILY
jgi:hypothetical protein